MRAPPGRSPHYRRNVLIGMGELVVFVVFLALVGSVGWWLWRYLRRDAAGSGAPALPARERAWVAVSP